MKSIQARRVYESAALTEWRVDWPSTPFKQGKTYIAHTYPGSDLIAVYTAAKRRPVSKIAGARIYEQVRFAIKAAGT